ncbi:hypothetical protein L910_2496 [Vibrio fluvialis PG41]|uniref:Uncharacterized protein n=1 Tax=Vibrio fluvialis PG41 TaxID=1336752 RepID=S7HWH4_VIBFL|nr:hypothetical protein L910_2496 [Vibrio fluvialis PG41]
MNPNHSHGRDTTQQIKKNHSLSHKPRSQAAIELTIER